MKLPLHFIEKYRNIALEEKLLLMYSNSSLNRYLRRITGICCIERNSFFHQAHHNFGTYITLLLRVPIETVDKMMRHMRIETMKLYAKVTGLKVDEDMKRLKAAGMDQIPGIYDEESIVKKQIRRLSCQPSVTRG